MSSSISSIRSASRFNLAALAVAALALFVALGGTSHAAGGLIGAKKIKNNSISSKKLKNNGVKSVDLANGTIEMTDLSGALQAKVNQLVGGLVDTAQLANGAVTNPKLADSSVSSAKVAKDSMVSGDIGASAIGVSELATKAVGSDEVVDGSLNAVDVGDGSGSVELNFPIVAAGSCATLFLDPPDAGWVGSRPSVVTPGPGFFGDVSFHSEGAGAQLRLKACNPTGAPVDPDNAGTSYNYIVFG